MSSVSLLLLIQTNIIIAILCNAQFPDVVLDRLPLITKPDGPAAARRLRAMAFLGPLVSLYTGRHRLNVDSRLGGLKQLSGRMRIQVILSSAA